MADLNDTATVFPTGIYQIETTDPVLGGAPNESTGAGMVNIPHQQLAKRTKVLKSMLDGAGIGATASPLVTLNTAKSNGTYRFASSDAQTPATGVGGVVIVMAESSSAVTQVAFDGATRAWQRVWTGSAWGPWGLIWRTFGASESLTGNGWQRLPSGLIIQWAQGSNQATSGNQTITLPLTFPNAHLRTVVGNLYQNAGAGAGGYGFISATTSQVTVARNPVDNGNGVTPIIQSFGW